MLQRSLAFLLTMTFSLPFFLVGIVVCGALVMLVLGIGPNEKSWSAVGLFTLLVPFGIFAFGLVGYALLIVGLRATRLERWYERQMPSGKPGWLDVPFAWVRSTVHRIVPGSPHEG